MPNQADLVDLSILQGDHRAVILLYLAGFSEREIAEELTQLNDRLYTRDQVHTIKQAAIRLLRRRVTERLAA